ncbi:MAG: hypothetical protein H6812_08905 [Phycisphaeraceae bacterium]|nr:hypothetical protein [Phycisphaerales bacterium]MCB9843360.1 hypothetical protein [Phycisphaeraceae bacterium]
MHLCVDIIDFQSVFHGLRYQEQKSGKHRLGESDDSQERASSLRLSFRDYARVIDQCRASAGFPNANKKDCTAQRPIIASMDMRKTEPIERAADAAKSNFVLIAYDYRDTLPSTPVGQGAPGDDQPRSAASLSAQVAYLLGTLRHFKPADVSATVFTHAFDVYRAVDDLVNGEGMGYQVAIAGFESWMDRRWSGVGVLSNEMGRTNKIPFFDLTSESESLIGCAMSAASSEPDDRGTKPSRRVGF